MTNDHFPRTIAIDGPAASGKSILAEKIATQLGYFYLDTGLMYRAVTNEALRREFRLRMGGSHAPGRIDGNQCCAGDE